MIWHCPIFGSDGQQHRWGIRVDICDWARRCDLTMVAFGGKVAKHSPCRRVSRVVRRYLVLTALLRKRADIKDSEPYNASLDASGDCGRRNDRRRGEGQQAVLSSPQARVPAHRNLLPLAQPSVPRSTHPKPSRASDLLHSRMRVIATIEWLLYVLNRCWKGNFAAQAVVDGSHNIPFRSQTREHFGKVDEWPEETGIALIGHFRWRRWTLNERRRG